MYLKTVGQPELYTDLVRLGTEQMNGFSHRENRTDAGTDENRDWVDLPGSL